MTVATCEYIATSAMIGLSTSEPIAHAHMQSSQHVPSSVLEQWCCSCDEWCVAIAFPHPCCAAGTPCASIIAGRAETIASESIATRAQRRAKIIERITGG